MACGLENPAFFGWDFKPVAAFVETELKRGVEDLFQNFRAQRFFTGTSGGHGALAQEEGVAETG